MSWDNLSFRDKAEFIKTGVSNGLTRIGDIKDAYDDFSSPDDVNKGVMDYVLPDDVRKDLGLPNKFKTGGQKEKASAWRSSDSIRKRISDWEGSSMKTNRAFDLEDRDFWNAIPENVRSRMSQDELDALYSYSYNVGANAFKRKVVPQLERLYAGDGSVEDVQDAMTASLDSKYRGLARRRAVERQMFGDAYSRNMSPGVSQGMLDVTREMVKDIPQYGREQLLADVAPIPSGVTSVPSEAMIIPQGARESIDPMEESRKRLATFLDWSRNPQEPFLDMMIASMNKYGEGGPEDIKSSNSSSEDDDVNSVIGLGSTFGSYLGKGIAKVSPKLAKKIARAMTNPDTGAIMRKTRKIVKAGTAGSVVGQGIGAMNDTKQAVDAFKQGNIGTGLFNMYQALSGVGQVIGETNVARFIPGWGSVVDTVLDVNGYISDVLGTIVDGKDLFTKTVMPTGTKSIEEVTHPFGYENGSFDGFPH